MLQIEAFEAENALGALLERGEEIVITRRGKPAVRLVSSLVRIDRAEARAAATRIRARAGIQGPKILAAESRNA